MPAPFLSLFLLTPSADGFLGVYLDEARAEAVVLEVIPDSPAAKAGLQVGDVMLAVGDVATPTREQFSAAILGAKAGDRLSLKVRRDGREQLVLVRLATRPDAATPEAEAPGKAPARPRSPAPAGEPGAPSAPAVPGDGVYLGISVRETERGLVVDRVLAGSPAAAAGVAAWEVLEKVGDAAVRDLSALEAALRTVKPGVPVALGLRNSEGTRSVLVTPTRRDAAPASTPAPVPGAAPRTPAADRDATPLAREEQDLRAELAALRAELAELRRQLEALRAAKGRE